MTKKAKAVSKKKRIVRLFPVAPVLLTLFVVFAMIFLVESVSLAGAQDWLLGLGIAVGAGGLAIAISLILAIAVMSMTVPILGWIVAAILIIAAAIMILIALMMGGDDPEQSDDQGDGRDVFEDEEKLDRFLERERRMMQVRDLCDRDVPPISGSFSKRALRTGNEYTYSYTLAACDRAKAFFVRLNGTQGLLKTEFHSVRKNDIFSNSETILNQRDFDAVCIKIIGETKLVCIKEGSQAGIGDSESESSS